MKYFHLKGLIFKEDTSALTETESENVFNEFIKFLESRDLSFFGKTELKDSL